MNSTLRDGSRSTKCSAGQDGAASSGSSNSFSIQAENRFSVSRFQTPRKGQTLPATVPGRAGASARTAISRVTAPQPARVSVARQVPAAGDLTSASQKYGGPPWRSRERAATLPSGAISASSPSAGFSAVNSTRSGAPFHGTIGDGSIASSAASSQRALCTRVGGGEQKREQRERQHGRRRGSKPARWNQWSHLRIPRPHRSVHAQALAQSPG